MVVGIQQSHIVTNTSTLPELQLSISLNHFIASMIATTSPALLLYLFTNCGCLVMGFINVQSLEIYLKYSPCFVFCSWAGRGAVLELRRCLWHLLLIVGFEVASLLLVFFFFFLCIICCVSDPLPFISCFFCCFKVFLYSTSFSLI